MTVEERWEDTDVAVVVSTNVGVGASEQIRDHRNRRRGCGATNDALELRGRSFQGSSDMVGMNLGQHKRN